MARATAWAGAVAPGCARLLVPGESVAEAAREAFARHGGPVLLAAADTPRLGPEHAAMALGDLAAGAAASLGPGMDGGWYLAALAAPHTAVLALLDESPGGADAMGRLFAVAHEAGLEVGMLRMERMLRTARDVRALRADPRTPDILRSALPQMG
ncbi:MAG: hypothetical protein QOE86_4510 [Solirubrobacteraceae bacterium]|nr:hypothetical protein [Solirubrobacteraceae bacterium]